MLGGVCLSVTEVRSRLWNRYSYAMEVSLGEVSLGVVSFGRSLAWRSLIWWKYRLVKSRLRSLGGEVSFEKYRWVKISVTAA